MRKVIYQFNTSADGYIAGPGDDIDGAAPSVELHRAYNALAASVDTFLYGRKIYEIMEPFWPTADQQPGLPPEVVEFSRLYRGSRRWSSPGR